MHKAHVDSRIEGDDESCTGVSLGHVETALALAGLAVLCVRESERTRNTANTVTG